jgi:hypothetical protein
MKKFLIARNIFCAILKSLSTLSLGLHMLIKYYNLQGDIHIIEGIQDVSIPKDPKDSSDDKWSIYSFDPSLDSGCSPPKIIEYAKDGPCRLYVYGTAYICNDDGKTLHKVVVQEDIV